MTQTPEIINAGVQQTIMARAVDKTPAWVWGFSGGFVVLTVCLIAILQLGGFSGPLQRIMNAQAAGIERSAESLAQSADAFKVISARVDTLQVRVDALEVRADATDRYHRGN